MLYALIFASRLASSAASSTSRSIAGRKEDRQEREWVVTPSHCPKCGARIRWFDNVPLVVLAAAAREVPRLPRADLDPLPPGRAGHGAALGAHRLAGGATTAGPAMAPTAMTGWHVFFAIFFASLYLLTVIIDFADQDHPRRDQPWRTLLGAWAVLWLCAPQPSAANWLDSLIGMAVLSAFLFLLFLFGGMGFGDVKLALGMGVLFGWQLVIVAGFVGVVLGGTVACGLLIWHKARGRTSSCRRSPSARTWRSPASSRCSWARS